MSQANEQRVKDKIKNIRQENPGVTYNSILNNLFLERYLARISFSKYNKDLIFKGGLCLDKYLDLGRYTKDIDFLLKNIEAKQDSISSIINEISRLDIKDEFIFDVAQIEILDVEHRKYPGYRIKVPGALGKIRNTIFIDIGVGDVVRPKVLEVELMSDGEPLFESTISLNAYPIEYIFSEKVEAMLRLGELNSRMKDFFDCHQILNSKDANKNKLHAALRETFQNREQEIKKISVSADGFTKNWNSFLKKNGIGKLELQSIIDNINAVISGVEKKN